MLDLPPREPWPIGGAEWMPAGRPLALVPGGPLPSPCSCLLGSEQSWFPASCQHVSGQAAVVSGPPVTLLTLDFAT